MELTVLKTTQPVNYIDLSCCAYNFLDFTIEAFDAPEAQEINEPTEDLD